MVKVLQSGLYSTIQDLGRFGFQHLGVPCSGVMDQHSARMANLLLANDANCAVLELTGNGPKLEFTSNTNIVITGANMLPMINDNSVLNDSVINIKGNDILSFGKRVYGLRSYIAVKGGFKTKAVLGSRSMYSKITKESTIKRGDYLPIADCDVLLEPNLAKLKVPNIDYESKVINVFKGPEFDLLNISTIKKLLEKEFKISNSSNRMAYSLNESIENSLNSILTSVVIPGTVQLTPSGQLIILMRDCQVTGGYPRVLQLSEESINKLSQRSAGNSIKFRLKAQ
ncbi:biotin-dependent carboxyltransferase family protein [Ichthyenterobacterium sp. W332]|uniref:Biotin-dependent carboxyltransferase family protein n=1 Tax=Microcosmobacter mediterraneus TaxID=3075607 RepID=A0ABU2YKT8_9FLAO|nr:biotin-dependent carboxyltransferase family protein [Ichthyenterobacterium sp. W332]MDT0558769.1 biotin-dependent carboxyltransferase family protein [Ichthyenterobacterium sp. W332]